LGLTVGLALTGTHAFAQDWSDRPDEFAPTGIETDTGEEAGAWTFSYQYTRTAGSGLLDGRGSVSSGDVFADGYNASPHHKVREAHLFSALYGYDETTSIRFTLPWLNNEVTMRSSLGGIYGMRSTGMGDLRITGLFDLSQAEGEGFHAQLGVSLPTGSLDERGITPFGGGTSEKLPYYLQLSSGTVDLIPGITYVQQDESTSLGVQAREVLRFSENSDDYQLGNETILNAWVSRVFKDDLSGSLRLGYHHLGNVKGADPEIDATQSPMHDPRNQGGDSVGVFAGLNYTQTGGHSFGFELGGPLWQDLNGPQVEHDISYSLGWHFSF